MVICPVCEGSKVIEIKKKQRAELCPKCGGKGQIVNTVKEEKEANQTLLHG